MSLFDPLTGTVTELTPAAVSPTSVIEAWVERLDPAKGEDFGWERIAVVARGVRERGGRARRYWMPTRSRSCPPTK